MQRKEPTVIRVFTGFSEQLIVGVCASRASNKRSDPLTGIFSGITRFRSRQRFRITLSCPYFLV